LRATWNGVVESHSPATVDPLLETPSPTYGDVATDSYLYISLMSGLFVLIHFRATPYCAPQDCRNANIGVERQGYQGDGPGPKKRLILEGDNNPGWGLNGIATQAIGIEPPLADGSDRSASQERVSADNPEIFHDAPATHHACDYNGAFFSHSLRQFGISGIYTVDELPTAHSTRDRNRRMRGSERRRICNHGHAWK
jgi:hypothetical protein